LKVVVKQTIVLALLVFLVAGFAVQIQQVSADSFVMGTSVKLPCT
jgi:hypothetical protein